MKQLKHDCIEGGREPKARGDSVSRVQAAASRARNFALAGAFGLAALFGVGGLANAQPRPEAGTPVPDAGAPADAERPRIINPGDASAEAAPVSTPADAGVREAAPVQPAPAQTARASTPTAQELLATLNALVAGGEGHPAEAQDAPTLAANFVRLFDLRELILAGRPASDSPMCAVYARALGGSCASGDAGTPAYQDREAAVAALESALARTINNLARTAQGPESFGAHAELAEQRLGRLQSGIRDAEANYLNFDPLGNTITCLYEAVGGGPACTETLSPTQEHPSTDLPPLPLIELPPFDLGSQFFLSSLGRSDFVMADPSLTNPINSLFDYNSGNAQEFLTALKDAMETLGNSPTDAAAQASAAHALHDALARIPGDKSVWSHQNFNDAMAALDRGDLRGGLTALRREVGLNAIWSELGLLHHGVIGQRALARLRTAVTFRLLEADNLREFIAYRRGSEDRAYPWDVLRHDLTLNYSWLVMSARLQAYTIDLDRFTLTPYGAPRAVLGDGHALDAGYAVTFGGSMARNPVESTLSLRFGGLWWNIHDQDERGRPLDFDGWTLYGRANMDFNRVGYEGRNSAFRLNRWGVGLSFPVVNPYTYYQFNLREGEWNRWRFDISFTPSYMMFWGKRTEGMDDTHFFQHRFGIDVRQDFTYQQSRNLTIYTGAGVRYESGFEHQHWFGGDTTPPTEQSYNVRGISHVIEPYAHFSLRAARGFAIDTRLGYYLEFGGDEAFHIFPAETPWYQRFTGSVNLVFTPGEWSSDGRGGVVVTAGSGEGR